MLEYHHSKPPLLKKSHQSNTLSSSSNGTDVRMQRQTSRTPPDGDASRWMPRASDRVLRGRKPPSDPIIIQTTHNTTRSRPSPRMPQQARGPASPKVTHCPAWGPSSMDAAVKETERTECQQHKIHPDRLYERRFHEMFEMMCQRYDVTSCPSCKRAKWRAIESFTFGLPRALAGCTAL